MHSAHLKTGTHRGFPIVTMRRSSLLMTYESTCGICTFESQAPPTSTNVFFIARSCLTSSILEFIRLRFWCRSVNESSFNIVDIKPDNMEELTEVAKRHFTRREFRMVLGSTKVPQPLVASSSDAGLILCCGVLGHHLCTVSSYKLQYLHVQQQQRSCAVR